MTDDELNNLEALCSKATPAPWSTALLDEEVSPGSDRWSRIGNLVTAHGMRDGISNSIIIAEVPLSGLSVDADFIAASRAALPTAISELRNLRIELANIDRAIAVMLAAAGEHRLSDMDEFELPLQILQATRSVISNLLK